MRSRSAVAVQDVYFEGLYEEIIWLVSLSDLKNRYVFVSNKVLRYDNRNTPISHEECALV